MRRLFARLPFTRKLIAISMLTTTVVVLLLALAVISNEAIKQKGALYQKRTEQMTAVADIIASRSTAALVFDDQATTQENLNALGALRADTQLAFAAVYRNDGELVAEYRDHSQDVELREEARQLGCSNPEQTEIGRLLPVCRLVILDDESIGDVRLVIDMSTDLAHLKSSLIRFLILILVLLFVGFGLALLLASWLQKFASAPILTLQQAMQRVSEQRDYSVRVPHTSDDELGALTDGFNDMLAQIQIRDAELARYSSQLEEVVAARTQELAEANRRRIVWLENLARFLRHELKNTTVGVTSSLDLIERRAQSDRIAKYLERARSSVAFMKRLLDSVGGATTLEASFYTDSKSRLDLAELVVEHIDTYQNLYPNVELITDCDNNVEIEGNPTRLVQLLDKLVSNAVDHGASGAPITVTVKKTDGQALLSVTDEGEPLPEGKARMFELFVSLRHAERRDSDNLGLGLYIVKLIAEFHGGQVQAENLPDERGAVFTVSLPLVQKV